jgi:hypothetical protein
MENAVETRIRLWMMAWDDIAVYFHRSNIQYMHPDVKTFFSRYNFIRPYVANLTISVPDPEFVPEQLALFCTADIMLTERGLGDFDVKKKQRNFWGHAKTWTKHYDGLDVSWDKVQDKYFDAYQEIRHAHAVEAFEKPADTFVTVMPKQGKEFSEAESLFGESPKIPVTVSPSLKSPSPLMVSKKLIAENYRFQGLRATESYDKTDPDLVIWKDATTPLEVISLRTVNGPSTLDVGLECQKEIKYAQNHGLQEIHLICLDKSDKKIFDARVGFTEKVEIKPSTAA